MKFLLPFTLSLTLSAVAPCAQPDEEGYAFYSALYRTSNSLQPGEVVAIAEEVGSYNSTHDNCFQPTTTEDRKMADAARALSGDHSKWQRHFDFGHEYLLIPKTGINKAIGCISVNRSLPECAPYAKVKLIRILSNPVFNADHTRALVLIDKICGSLCGGGSWPVLRKTAGVWRAAPDTENFVKCSWQY